VVDGVFVGVLGVVVVDGVVVVPGVVVLIPGVPGAMLGVPPEIPGVPPLGVVVDPGVLVCAPGVLLVVPGVVVVPGVFVVPGVAVVPGVVVGDVVFGFPVWVPFIPGVVVVPGVPVCGPVELVFPLAPAPPAPPADCAAATPSARNRIAAAKKCLDMILLRDFLSVPLSIRMPRQAARMGWQSSILRTDYDTPVPLTLLLCDTDESLPLHGDPLVLHRAQE
jgi:hypothetical protein